MGSGVVQDVYKRQDQLLGADRGAQAAVVALGVIDAGKILFHGNGVLCATVCPKKLIRDSNVENLGEPKPVVQA